MKLLALSLLLFVTTIAQASPPGRIAITKLSVNTRSCWSMRIGSNFSTKLNSTFLEIFSSSDTISVQLPEHLITGGVLIERISNTIFIYDNDAKLQDSIFIKSIQSSMEINPRGDKVTLRINKSVYDSVMFGDYPGASFPALGETRAYNNNPVVFSGNIIGYDWKKSLTEYGKPTLQGIYLSGTLYDRNGNKIIHGQLSTHPMMHNVYSDLFSDENGSYGGSLEEWTDTLTHLYYGQYSIEPVSIKPIVIKGTYGDTFYTDIYLIDYVSAVPEAPTDSFTISSINGSIEVNYASATHAQLQIYNLLGILIESYPLVPGESSHTFSATSLSSGTYLAVLSDGGVSQSAVFQIP